MQRLAVVILALVACACSGGGGPTDAPEFDPCQPLVLEPAADATDAERASVAAAVELWRTEAGMAATMSEVAGAPRVPVVFRDAPLAFLGVYERGTIVVNHGLTSDAARAVVVAHELGHAFGLVHVEDPASVMHPGNLSVAPGPADVAALTALWGSCGQ